MRSHSLLLSLKSCVTCGRPHNRQELLGNESKPRSNGNVVLLQPPQEPLKVLSLHILHILHLISIGVESDVLLQKKDVVHLVLPPHAIRGACIVDASEVSEVTRPGLLLGDAELKLQASLCSIPHPQSTLLDGLPWGVQRVGAASVGVVAREDYFREMYITTRKRNQEKTTLSK
ncbi:hypothetical protein E2C01_006799 [Portunus trituberculatus]|uniref:Uncharacterized protein n=1 Tax=Portunus trituberculatus TaxID=210409 RepID=A0A5B7CYA5_PORTR|nr:hypothetical protein [Portunus trituberculatus]